MEEIFAHPLHPYTQGLLESIPARCGQSLGKGNYLKTIPGSVPSLYNIAPGCRFYDRCSYADEECAGKEPPLAEIDPGHFVSCWKYSAKKNN